MGAAGVALGLATMLFVKEPLRGGFIDEAIKKKELEKKEAARIKELSDPK
jgi:hypothetical protein